MVEQHHRLGSVAGVFDDVAHHQRVRAELGGDFPMQHEAFAERPGLANRARQADLIVVALPALGNADVLGRDVADPAVQAEALVAVLNGRTDVAEPGGGQQTGEEVAQEPLGAVFDEMRRPDDAALGDVANRRAFVEAQAMSSARPGSAVNSKPVPVLTSIASTPLARPELSSLARAPAIWEIWPTLRVRSSLLTRRP